MYVVFICILAPLIQSGFSLNEEETDLNSLSSNYDGVGKIGNSENWNSDQVETDVFDSISFSLLAKICKNSDSLVYVAQEDVTIDCKAFNGGDQPVEQIHDIIKREAEGSGDDAISSKEDPPISTTEEINSDDEEITETTVPEEPTKEETTILIKEETTTILTKEPTTILTKEETTTILTKEETTTLPTEETTAMPTEETTETPTKETTPTKEETTTTPTEKITETRREEDTTTAEIPAKFNEIETAPAAPKETDRKEETNPEGPERPKESTEDTKKAGSKDTTILVFLFVAVVVVGALAFGYNFIKKRRQQSADLERVERASIKRSLQNLTKPEGEAERKPLIGDAKEVEMVDMKKPVEENNEKPSNEQIIKT
ncbi:hypothetical protein BDFB_007236 [Asbolus verrucosus]|uniref:Uncharacterized protein n=1 Tax=Asbolus verrucosus TaxID=1661398 RepID=A0A482VY45_ASBVE|nr:hypothetical protein BDFB_007236 [Asbolus verrucosus]